MYFWKKKGFSPSGPGALWGLKELIDDIISLSENGFEYLYSEYEVDKLVV